MHDLWCSLDQVFIGVCDVWWLQKCSYFSRMSQCLTEAIDSSMCVRFTLARVNGRTERTTEMMQMYSCPFCSKIRLWPNFLLILLVFTSWCYPWQFHKCSVQNNLWCMMWTLGQNSTGLTTGVYIALSSFRDLEQHTPLSYPTIGRCVSLQHSWVTIDS